MARLDWLGDVLRGAGLKVLEYPGWRSRGRDGMRPRVVILHHTATHWTTADSVVERLLVQGRSDLPGPLCHIGWRRDGTAVLIAAGKANHAGAGAWRDANESVEAIGIEAYNYGASVPSPSREPWPKTQIAAIEVGIAALLKHIGRDQSALCAHREWATPLGRKPDPSGIDMAAMRTRVGALIKGGQTLVIHQGLSGNHIKPWQTALNTAIDLNGLAVPKLTVDGDFGQATKAAVMAYQIAAGINTIVPEVGALDDYTRDLLVEYTRSD